MLVAASHRLRYVLSGSSRRAVSSQMPHVMAENALRDLRLASARDVFADVIDAMIFGERCEYALANPCTSVGYSIRNTSGASIPPPTDSLPCTSSARPGAEAHLTSQRLSSALHLHPHRQLSPAPDSPPQLPRNDGLRRAPHGPRGRPGSCQVSRPPPVHPPRHAGAGRHDG